MMRGMSQNRAYAGPYDAAEAQVAADRFVLVLRQDITDEQADALGYSLDSDDAVKRGRPLAVRTVTVSDALAGKLDADEFVDAESGETVKSWPNVGGATSDDNIVDDDSHPATRDVNVENVATGEVETLSSAEVDRRAYDAAAAEASLLDGEAAQARDAANASVAEQEQRERDAARDRLNARLLDITQALDIDEDADEDHRLPEGERVALIAERDRITDDLKGSE